MSKHINANNAAERRLSSLDAAAAFIEDYDHIRNLFDARAPNREDARRISGILRRILVEDDLKVIAAPRIGRIEIVAPDLTEAMVAVATRNPIAFYGMGAAMPHATPLFYLMVGAENGVLNTNKQINLNIDHFRNQKIIYFQDKWFSRNEIIRYIANEKSGVHSKKEGKIIHKSSLATLEKSAAMNNNLRIPKITISNPLPVPPKSTYVKNEMNPILYSIYYTAGALIYAPDIERLASSIRAEVG